jgi:HSP20 family protein
MRMSSANNNDGFKGTPKELFTEFMNSMDRLFSERQPRGLLKSMNDFFSTASLDGGGFSVEMEETELAYIVKAIIPGVKRNQIELEMLPQAIRISVNQTESTSLRQTEEGWTHNSRSQSRSSRIINLPKPINEKGVTANHRNGILVIKIPKHKGKLIQIEE